MQACHKAIPNEANLCVSAILFYVFIFSATLRYHSYAVLFNLRFSARLHLATCVFVLGLCLSPRLQAQDVVNNAMRCGADDLLKEQLKRQNISIEEYLLQMREVLQANSPASNQ